MKLVIFIIVAFAIIYENEAATDKVICYYESWKSYAGVNPENFDANLCTHVNYAFIDIKDDGNLAPKDEGLDIGQGLYQRVADMKKSNPNLKVLLSVGGGSAGVPERFAAIAADPGRRATLIGSANYFLTTYNFDGVDIDWELPGANDKGNFITLLREIKDNFSSKGWLVTAAVSAIPGEGYDVPQMSNILDIINIMTYDFYGPWSTSTGQNSPLYGSSVESDWEKDNLNLAAAGRHWVNAGANAQKMTLGVAFYGRTFTLADPNQHGIHAPINGIGPGNEGTLQYSDICRDYGGWTRVWDDEQKNPYKFSGNAWLGYDDVDSITMKAQYIRDNNFGGVMIWAIDGDDVSGSCGPQQDLLHHINNALH